MSQRAQVKVNKPRPVRKMQRAEHLDQQTEELVRKAHRAHHRVSILLQEVEEHLNGYDD